MILENEEEHDSDYEEQIELEALKFHLSSKLEQEAYSKLHLQELDVLNTSGSIKSYQAVDANNLSHVATCPESPLVQS